MTAYLELTQTTAETPTDLSITATNVITSAGGLHVSNGIVENSKIRLSGWSTAGNNTDVVVKTVTATTITTTTSPLTIEAAGQISNTGTTIRFVPSSPNLAAYINDTGSGFTNFVVGQKITVTGSTLNNLTLTVQSVSSGKVEILESTLTPEEAGASVVIIQSNKIQTRGYYSDKAGGIEKADSKSNTVWFRNSMISVSDIIYSSQGAFTKLLNGSISIHRSSLTGFDLTNRIFDCVLKLDDDDNIIFSDKAIIRDITNHKVDFKLKTFQYDANFYKLAPDINATTYTQGRIYPFVFGEIDHADPLLMDDTTHEYYAGAWIISSVFEDGVEVSYFGTNLDNSYSPGDSVNYGLGRWYQYLGSCNESPPTSGATSGAISLTYNAAAKTITRASGSFITDGFISEGLINVDGTVSNDGNYTIVGGGVAVVTALVLTVVEALVNEGPVSSTVATTSIGRHWRYTGVSTGASDFRASWYWLTSVEPLFKLRAKPTGEVTCNLWWVDLQFIDAVEVIVKTLGLTLDSTNADDSASVRLNFGGLNQVSCIELLKRFCDFNEHIFYISGSTLYLIDKVKFSSTITRTGSTAFALQLDKTDLQLENIIFKYESVWEERVPISSPVELKRIERKTEVWTGSESGDTKKIEAFDFDNDRIVVAMNKKVTIHSDYSPFVVALKGIDPSVEVGVRISFDAGWVSGYLIIQQYTNKLKDSLTICVGIANNLVYV